MTGESEALQARFKEAFALHRQGNVSEAARLYLEVLAQAPDHFDAAHMLGLAALQGRMYEQGVALMRKAIALNGEVATAHNNLGKGLLALRRSAEALGCFEKAIALAPDFAEPHVHRGGILLGMRRASEALECFQKAVGLDPGNAELQRNCGHILSRLARYEETLAAYDRAFRLQPDLVGIEGYRLYARMHLCDWEDIAAEQARLVASIRSGKANAQPFIFLAVPATPSDQRQCAQAWLERHFPPVEPPRWNGQRYDHDRIRVAYLSADFRQHAASTLMAGMFECHDRSRFEVTAISFGPDDRSELRKRLEAAFDRFVDARGRSDDEIADLLRSLEIDIAVDLMGFTTESRTGIFARRPVPVQAHYMGFPGTMAAPYLDYIMADGVVIPREAHAHYSEKVVSLPNSYFVNDDKRAIAARAFRRSDLGLPAKGFVFCCFNASYKITPEVFEVWMRILEAVDGSVLWLYRENAKAADNLRREARRRGIDGERLVFAHRLPPSEHLARYPAADLFLDTLPYNAHTTAADALWAGLPVLTCCGETFVGRVAASLLDAVGLLELVTTSLDDYERLAVELARDAKRLAEIRTNLAANRTKMPLFDTSLFTRHMEAAFVAMHERHQAGLPPDDIDVQA
jgi:protein O-GlcNAc transferase